MTSCYDSHQVGERYLIAGARVLWPLDLAKKSANYRGEPRPLPAGFDPATAVGVVSGACSGSGLVSSMPEDISFLRAWKLGKSQPRVLGRVNQIRWPESSLPLAGVTATLISAESERKILTGNDGAFAIDNIEPGRHRLRLERSEYPQRVEEVTVPPGGCGWVDAVLPTNNRIRMLVTDAAEHPIAHVPLTLLYDVSDREGALPGYTETDDSGVLEARGIPAATYLIVVNPGGPSSPRAPYPTTYYPGTPTGDRAIRVPLGPNEQRLDLHLRLPEPIPTRRIRVKVVDKDGNPAVGATVFSKAGSVEQTNRDGRVTVSVLSGVDTSIEAWQEFDTGNGTKPWVDWKRWRAAMPVPGKTGDVVLEIRFVNWRRNGDW